jgi:uncharacterized membrane protein YjfL (UPF0719 family)
VTENAACELEKIGGLIIGLGVVVSVGAIPDVSLPRYLSWSRGKKGG